MGSIGSGKFWFRDLDSNQDTQLQRLMSYQLDDPGIVANTKQTLHLELCRNVPMWVHWVQPFFGDFSNKIGAISQVHSA